ncbi:hypothetical protein MUK42_36315 [Musa troglodytarum]|uniref:Uncharacterized protein n=1 Tax=Musa troglodytarum TaxID=320322 RepID=A0A9E7E8Y8_9LILI|nr:hypothetical protein MUK42_36315 [Musa troglodytarum]
MISCHGEHNAGTCKSQTGTDGWCRPAWGSERNQAIDGLSPHSSSSSDQILTARKNPIPLPSIFDGGREEVGVSKTTIHSSTPTIDKLTEPKTGLFPWPSFITPADFSGAERGVGAFAVVVMASAGVDLRGLFTRRFRAFDWLGEPPQFCKPLGCSKKKKRTTTTTTVVVWEVKSFPDAEVKKKKKKRRKADVPTATCVLRTSTHCRQKEAKQRAFSQRQVAQRHSPPPLSSRRALHAIRYT